MVQHQFFLIGFPHLTKIFDFSGVLGNAARGKVLLGQGRNVLALILSSHLYLSTPNISISLVYQGFSFFIEEEKGVETCFPPLFFFIFILSTGLLASNSGQPFHTHTLPD